LKKNQLNASQKIILIGFILFILVLSIISTTSNLLKNDAEEAHKNIANIYNKTFSEHLNNNIYNIELFINGLEVIYSENKDEKIINDYLLKYLSENPYIRSINIIDNKIISKSTNKSNLGLFVLTDEFYPKPIFKKDILRFGNSFVGRDFYEGKEIKNQLEYSNKESLFLPISKVIHIENKDYIVLLALNIEQFLNKYDQNLEKELGQVEILNFNGEVLFSNDQSIKIGEKLLDSETLDILKKRNSYLGIKKFASLNKNIISIENIKDYPLSLLLRLDYDKTLENWEEKRLNFLFIIAILLVFIIMLILIFIIKNEKTKQEEIEIHKSKIESQKRFKILFEQTNFLSFILSEDGKINKINNTALIFLGNTKNTYIDIYIWDLYCFNSECKIWLENVIKNHQKNDIEKELVITNLNSEKRYIDITINSIIIDDKKELVLFGKDISEKKEHERELRQAYQVFKNAHDGIMITDDKNKIINVNDSFIHCTGYKLEEVLNQNPSILNSGHNDENFYENMWKELLQNNYWDGEIVNKRKDGSTYVEKLTISAVYNKKNKLTNYIGIFSDITKQKQQEEIIKEKERMLFQQSKMASMGEMLGNIAHQWRQPLSVISVAAGAVKLGHEYKGTYSEKEIIDFLDSINNSTQYLSETIDDFRNFFTHDIENKEFDCVNAINKTLKLLSSDFKYKEITIIFKRLESDNIFASENEFKQVMMNILNNAKDILLEKVLDENKYIFIDVYIQNSHINIDILDNAGGIDKNIIDKIFEPYFTTKHKSIGTGIGLYMVEEILTKHMNGEISVVNENYIYENVSYKGAKFSIKIPMSKNIKD
jgi:PAS domain S-box-containing protein